MVLSPDVLAEILLRLPPSSRRRARLVCRFWRDVVNERTTELRSDTGDIIFSSCRKLRTCSDPLEAELHACMEGLNLALQ